MKRIPILTILISLSLLVCAAAADTMESVRRITATPYARVCSITFLDTVTPALITTFQGYSNPDTAFRNRPA